jgi:hypothetical protein
VALGTEPGFLEGVAIVVAILGLLAKGTCGEAALIAHTV